MKILIYSDSRVYGGHEEMLLKHLEISKWPQGTWVGLTCAKSNNKYLSAAENLKEAGKVSQITIIRDSSKRLDQFFLFLNLKRFLITLRLISNLKPDIILVSAGRIEGCNLGFWCSKILNLPTIYYLPMIHKRAKIRPGLISALRDLYNNIIYSGSKNIIVITEGQKNDLDAIGVSKTFVVKNVIEIPSTIKCRAVNNRNLTLGFLGRFDQRQKNVNFMVSLVGSLLVLKEDIRCIVQGDGPDRDQMLRKIECSGLTRCFEIRDWTANVELFFNDIDVLVIPSFYEGMPLVMLQALAREIMVVATRVDGMAEILPDSALFSVDGVAQARDTVINLSQHSSHWKQVFQQVKWAIEKDACASQMSKTIIGLYDYKFERRLNHL